MKIKTGKVIDMQQQVASIIQAARVQQDLSQEQLAEKVGCSRSTIARIEGCTYSPGSDQLFKILEVLDLPFTINNETIL